MTTVGVPRALEFRLALTSPPMRGEQVRQLQLILRHNRYGTFDPGRGDGVFDEQTASAVRRARYWLGYPESLIDESVDARLRDLLAGEAELPRAWKATRTRRFRRAEDKVLWDAALVVAREQLGHREDPPGSKLIPYTLWYGLLCPWSVVFPSFCYAQAGSRAFSAGSRYAYAPYLLDDARRSRNFLSITVEPLPGDLALLDSDSDGDADRLAFFEGWADDGAPQQFDAIEGDVGYDGAVGGEGAVARTTRQKENVLAFVHVRA
jgi:peptidoglycan hydrolase-like protein with peptidoglycan-binding domain